MKTKLTLEFNDTEEEMRFAKFISYHTEISSALFQITHNLRKSTENFIDSKIKEPTNEEVLDFVIGFINENTEGIPNDILEF